VLCVKLIQLNTSGSSIVISNAPIFTLGIVAIPVFDTLRVFAIRIWEGRSPFDPDKNHIHHILTNNGWSHRFTAKMICGLHALVLIVCYFLKNLPQFAGFCILLAMMLLMVLLFQKMKLPPPSTKTIPANP
jgi:UDP-N-acetylmuramyl pentapeptide phosphotransferase/UDP-N-acetylglucosamine-1-phosphate transferase